MRQKKLERAGRIEILLDFYKKSLLHDTNEEFEDSNLVDMLTDIMHFCQMKKKRLCLPAMIEMAKQHYYAESAAGSKE